MMKKGHKGPLCQVSRCVPHGTSCDLAM